MRLLRGLKRRIAKKVDSALCRNHFEFYHVGFHGDSYLIALVQELGSLCETYVETGASVGASFDHGARTFPNLQCLGCEPDPDYFRHLKRRADRRQNASVYRMDSSRFIREILDPQFLDRETLFWLDAHGHGFQWPVKDEVSFILERWRKAYVLIDDFRVPNDDSFGYDAYDGQELGLPFISGLLDKRHDHTLYFPSYANNSSAYHPMRGWVLIDVGHETMPALPAFLRNKLKRF